MLKHKHNPMPLLRPVSRLRRALKHRLMPLLPRVSRLRINRPRHLLHRFKTLLQTPRLRLLMYRLFPMSMLAMTPIQARMLRVARMMLPLPMQEPFPIFR